MKQLFELRKLLRLKVENQGGNLFFFRVINSDGYKHMHVRTTPEGLKKFLIKLQAKDTATSPASQRNWTYAHMVQGIIDGTDQEIWVWQYKYDVTTSKFRDV